MNTWTVTATVSGTSPITIRTTVPGSDVVAAVLELLAYLAEIEAQR